MSPKIPEAFNALLAEGNDSSYTVRLAQLSPSQLPAGDVLVQIDYSALNYKDGLAVTGKGKIIRRFPMVLGIDLAGTVLESSTDEFKSGDRVLAVGQGLSETRWGAYSQLGRFPADALLHTPKTFDSKQAVAIGTAGFTAMLSVMALEQVGVKPSDREVIVTGAAGGVGSFAVLLLAKLGYKVAASTGRPETHSYLRDLGATTIVERAELAREASPLQSERWAGGIDSVGGQTLANILSSTASYGAVAACGLAGGASLKMTVFPFILRNVSLLGISSVVSPKPLRIEAWVRLASILKPNDLTSVTRIKPLTRYRELADEILAGQVRGRVVIDVNA
jgi:acrylyl-CoA reductase (NADPH)